MGSSVQTSVVASIVVPVRDAERTLAQCLDSLRRQSWPELEIIVVDHGSTDGSIALAEAAAGVELHRIESSTPYVARNVGASVARGSVLLFTEANCVAEPDWVERHLEALAQPGVSITIGPLAPITSTRRLDTFLAYERVRDEWNFASDYWKRYFGRPTNLAVRRESFERHGPFDVVLRGGDSILVQRIAREAGCEQVRFCPDAVVRHLELRDMRSCLRQRMGFSHLMRSLRSSHSAPLRVRDRLAIMRETIRRERYGVLRSLSLAGLLVLGNLAFNAGRWKAIVRPFRP